MEGFFGGAGKFSFYLANEQNNPMLIHTNDFCEKNGPKFARFFHLQNHHI